MTRLLSLTLVFVSALAHCAAFGVQPPAAAAEAPTTRLSATDLRSDVALLRRVFTELHPGLYRSNTPEQIEERFVALEMALGRDQTRREAFLALTLFTAGIKCGHTQPNPYNQSNAVAAEVFMRPDRLPFHFRWIDGRMIVTRDFSGEPGIGPGTEILSIDGTPVGAILSTMMSIARADGSNDDKRVRQLEVTGADRLEAFDVYFPLMFPVRGPMFELELVPAGGGAERTVNVPAQTYEARLKAHLETQPPSQGPDSPLWKLEYLPDGTALLRMRSWVAYNTKWDWTGFINDTFDELIAKDVPGLVIDLRGNEGGSGVGEVIAARLIDRPLPVPLSHKYVRYVKTPADLNGVLDTWDDSFQDWGARAVGPVDLAGRHTGLAAGGTAGFYRLCDEAPNAGVDAGRMIAPAGKRYGGRVFVLIDANNSSATFEFALMVKQHRLGTLVGQSTGGNQRGINGGAFFFVRLPKSGIEIDMPIKALFSGDAGAVPEDAGVAPDVPVIPTIEGITGRVDQEMEAVAKLRERR